MQDTGGRGPHLASISLESLLHPAGVAQLVERQPSKLNVAGSIPVTRFQKPLRMALKAIPRDAPGRAILLMRSQTRSHGD